MKEKHKAIVWAFLGFIFIFPFLWMFGQFLGLIYWLMDNVMKSIIITIFLILGYVLLKQCLKYGY